jgi:O-antigen biosynthesis protein WbqP
MANKLIALILIIFLFPIFIFIAIAILIEDGTPFLFLQKRIGLNYKYFYICKFRSMKNHTPNVATHLLNDPDRYILKIGKFIRKTSLDELPNLINIVKGDMVFVGPRPALHNQDDLMSYRLSLGVEKIKPGITGWAQINGRDNITLEKKALLDHEYLCNKSIFFDLVIIFKTFSKIIFGKEISH